MLTRIYGVAFSSKQELDDYLKMMEEAEKRDHRKLGQRVGTFMISEEVGKGSSIMVAQRSFYPPKTGGLYVSERIGKWI